MKSFRTLSRALLIICIIVADLWAFNILSKDRNITPVFILMLVGPQAILFTSLVIPTIPFAPYIAAAAGFFIGIEATGSLVDFLGDNIAIMITMAVLTFFVFPYAAFRWVSDMRDRKAALGRSDSTHVFYKRTKTVIPRGVEGKILGLCVDFLATVGFFGLSIPWLKEIFESGSIKPGDILAVLVLIFTMIIFGSLAREDLQKIREDFRKSNSFTDSIDSPTLELAAHDYNNAESFLDGGISMGDKYIFGSATEVFLEYGKLSAIIAAAVPDSFIDGINGPISIEMAESIAVDPYVRRKSEHNLIAETTDGKVYLLCHLPGTNAFQSYEKYWNRELCPVFERIHKKNPYCRFYPRIEIREAGEKDAQ